MKSKGLQRPKRTDKSDYSEAQRKWQFYSQGGSSNGSTNWQHASELSQSEFYLTHFPQLPTFETNVLEPDRGEKLCEKRHREVQ